MTSDFQFCDVISALYLRAVHRKKLDIFINDEDVAGYTVETGISTEEEIGYSEEVSNLVEKAFVIYQSNDEWQNVFNPSKYFAENSGQNILRDAARNAKVKELPEDMDGDINEIIDAGSDE